jgi:hypothetical protein
MLGTGFVIVMTWVLLMAPAAAAPVALLLAGLWILAALDMLSHARLVRRAGYSPADVAAGFHADARQRFDEEATGGRLLAILGHPAVVTSAVLLGLAALALGLALPALHVQSPHWRVKLAFLGTFVLALMVPVALGAPGRSSAWGRLWAGPMGRVWFAIAGLGLRSARQAP